MPSIQLAHVPHLALRTEILPGAAACKLSLNLNLNFNVNQKKQCFMLHLCNAILSKWRKKFYLKKYVKKESDDIFNHAISISNAVHCTCPIRGEIQHICMHEKKYWWNDMSPSTVSIYSSLCFISVLAHLHLEC